MSVVLATWLSGSPAVEPPATGFTRDANVVVITGLPGDVESERAYESQLGRLLECLSSAAYRPRKVHVLVDAPQRVRLPRDLPVEVSVGSRERFLNLARELATNTNPLAVIAWGHGGHQGRTPVLHVRGPRLSADDVVTFARTAGDRASHWILLFRGSGAFARALSAPKRTLLASEDDVSFTSDPIAVEPLLEVLRAQPGLPFEAMAERVGRGTAAWYVERGLARTEEPTLWRGPESKKLAVSEAASSPPSSAVREADAAHTVGEQRSATWLDVPRADPARFSDFDAVILRRRSSYTIGQSPALSQDIDEFVQVLTKEGEARGDVDVSYWPPDQTVTFLDCEVLQPDGRLVRLGSEAIREAAGGPPLGEYPTAHRRIFSLPGVVPGSVLRVHYRAEWKRFPLPYVFAEVPLASPIPILDSQVEVHVGAASTLHFAFGDAPSSKPEVSESPHGRTYLWRFSDTPPVLDEALAPPGRAPRLLLSTFPDWKAFADWYRRLIQLADVPTPEIQATAAEVVRGKGTELEKVAALYDYVTGLRYVAVPLGVNSHRPHAAANVLKNRYGDCKDKANLFNTLLKTQGIGADLVLVPRFSEAYDETPGLGFNHAISRVRVAGDWMWLDTTDEFARFGLLPPGDPGRRVLVVDDRTTGLTRLPLPTPEAHALRLLGSFVATGSEATGTLDLAAQGFADYALRLAARETDGKGTTRPLLAEGYRPTSGVFEMRRQTHSAVASLDQDFTWRAEGRWTALESPLGHDSRLVRAPFWIPREWDAALHLRRAALHLNQGYPLVLEQRFEISLPARSSNVSLPALGVNDEPPLRYRLEWSRKDNGALLASLRVELTAGDLTLEQTPTFQAQLRALFEALTQAAVYRFDGSPR
jgi:transglutaminase-like putative cysteine protease